MRETFSERLYQCGELGSFARVLRSLPNPCLCRHSGNRAGVCQRICENVRILAHRAAIAIRAATESRRRIFLVCATRMSARVCASPESGVGLLPTKRRHDRDG